MYRNHPDHPDFGSMQPMHDTIRALQQRMIQAETARDACRQATASMNTTVWDCDAADDWRALMNRRTAAWDNIFVVLLSASQALGAYIARWEQIHLNSEAARHNKERAAMLRVQADAVHAINPVAAGPLTEQSDHLYRIANQVLAEQMNERITADSELAGRISDLNIPSTTVAMQRLMYDNGQSDITSLNATELAKLVDSLSDQIVDSNGDDLDAIERLNGLLHLTADIPHLSEAFIDKIVGDGSDADRLIALTGALGLAIGLHGLPKAQSAVDTGATLRKVLADASRDWDQDKADRFMNAAIDPAAPHDHTELSFLAGDPENTTWGPAMALALANTVDEIERANPRRPFIDPNPTAAGILLSLAIDGDFRARDLGGRALAMLGQHSDIALVWVTDPAPDPLSDRKLGEARLDYWLGTRDSTADGHEGSTALFNGLVRASGSLGDPDVGYPLDPDSAAYERQQLIADTTTRAIEALAKNPTLTAATISETGGINLGDALGHHWNQFVPVYAIGETEISARNDNPENEQGSGDQTLWQFGEVPVINAAEASIAQLLGIASYQPAGLHRLEEHHSAYRDIVEAEAARPDSRLADDPDNPRQGVKHVTEGLGMLYGSRLGVLRDAESAKDAIIDDAIGVAAMPADAVKVGGGSLGGVAWSQGVAMTEAWLKDVLPNYEASALAQEEAAITARDSLVAVGIDEMYAVLLDAGHLETGRDSLRAEDFTSYRGTTAYWMDLARKDGLF